MEFIDLKAQYSRIENQVRHRIDTVLGHGKFIMGPEVHELEQELAQRTGAKHCLSCASGTDALLLPLLAWGIGVGDAVFVPAFTFFATAEVVALLGAVPVFVDVDPVTFNMDPVALDKAVRAVQQGDDSIYPLPQQACTQALKARAVIPVDLFGILADYPALLDIARQHDLLVLEDAAQSFGARRHGQPACHTGCHAATTSFFPAKVLGCYGDGGAVFTDDDALAARLQSLRIHGKGSDKYENVRIGINGRMDTLQAAIVLAKTPIFDDEIKARQQVADWYRQGLKQIVGMVTPRVPEDAVSVYGQYSVLVPERRDALVASLKARSIPTNIYYPKPLHIQTVFASMHYREDDMPVSASLSRNIVSLPFHPYMKEEDVQYVCTAAKEALA